MTSPAATFVIRRAVLADLDVMIEFSACLCRESEGREPAPGQLRAGVAAILQSRTWFGLIAVDSDGAPAGSLMMGGEEWSDWSNGMVWWVTCLYVAPEYRRSRLAEQLLDALEAIARDTSPHVIAIRGAIKATNIATQKALERIGHCVTGYLVAEKRLTFGQRD